MINWSFLHRFDAFGCITCGSVCCTDKDSRREYGRALNKMYDLCVAARDAIERGDNPSNYLHRANYLLRRLEKCNGYGLRFYSHVNVHNVDSWIILFESDCFTGYSD